MTGSVNASAGARTLLRACVALEAAAWVGTPYHPHARLKGVGVDCAMLLAEVYQGVGLIDRVEPGHYPVQWQLHQTGEMFIEWIQRAGGRPVDVPGLGDIGVWRYGRTHSHGGIVVEPGADPLIVHAYRGLGVVATHAAEQPLRGQAVRWFTLFEGTAQ